VSTDWQRVRAVFEQALDHEGPARAVFLDRACAGDADLRQRVERLLVADTQAGAAVIDGPPAPSLLASVEEDVIGRRIGHYTVRGVLGVGGMSTVFEAEQDQPRRTVALKTMRCGLLSDSSRRRFALESEILGRLRHPAIAEVYEAGTWTEPLTGATTPYFAMELVAAARPLDVFVRDQRLGLRGVLELFAQVCDGVAQGHLLRIVHRDLKPANILVDRNGRPKIIDFGIARATEADVEGGTLLTEAGQVLGTVQYMAPEQIEGRPEGIDERTDVWALGVILYELLAGRPPFDVAGHSIVGFARLVREQPLPTLPQVPRELNWVLGRSLTPEREARYASAAALADEVRRFLRNEPLSVGPPSSVYRLHKFLRRNRVLVSVLAVLVLGIAGTSWQWQRAEGALRDARRQSAKAEHVNAFLVDLIQAADPYTGQGSRPELTLRDVLAAASQRLDRLREPDVEADLRFNIGNAQRALGQLEAAKASHARALELRRQLYGDLHQDVAEAENAVALTAKAAGDLDAAARHYQAALAISRALRGDGDAQVAAVLLNLGSLQLRLGKGDDAERALREGVAIYERLGDQQRFVAIGLGHLALLLRARGDLQGVVACCRRALAAYATEDQGEHPYAAMTHEQLGAALDDLGDLDGARPELEAAARIGAMTLGETSDLAARVHGRLGRLLFRQREFAAAEAHLKVAVPASAATAGADARSTLELRGDLFATLQARGEVDAARQVGEPLLADAERVLGAADDFTKRVRSRLQEADAPGGTGTGVNR